MPGAGPAFCTAAGGTKRGCLLGANAQRRQRYSREALACPSKPWTRHSITHSTNHSAIGASECIAQAPRPTTQLQAPLSQGGAATAAGFWHARSGARVLYCRRRYEAWVSSWGERPKKAATQPRGSGMPRSGTRVLYRRRRHEAWAPFLGLRPKEAAEPADKPGSVVDSHSSRRYVTAALKQPTRIQRGPRQWIPIWSCSRWGLPCRSVTGLAVRSYRTISPLPRASCETVRRYLSVALSVGLRRPGVTWHLALWSPDFPRHSCE